MATQARGAYRVFFLLMPRQVVCLLIALCAARIHAGPLTLQLSSSLRWPQGLTLRAEALSEDFRLAAAAQTLYAPMSSPQAEPSLLAGLSLPWLKAGPLTPAGVLREAENPMGFGPGSDVFIQPSGWLLDLSFPSRQPGIFFMPIPRALGVFFEPGSAGKPQRLGCVAGAGGRAGANLEGFVSVSEPSAEEPGEEWFRASAPFPGGRVLAGAARFRFEASDFGLAATLGASAGELCPPGAFVHLQLMVRLEDFSAYLLAAQADSTYVTPRGEHCRDALRLCGAAVLSRSTGSVKAELSRSVRQPGFSPAPFREHADDLSLSVQRTLVSDTAFSLAAGLSAARTFQENTDGSREDDVHAGASLTARISPLRFAAAVSGNLREAGKLSLSSEAVLDRRGSLIGLKGSLESDHWADALVSAAVYCTLKKKEFSLNLEAGFDKPCMEGARFSALWVFRETQEEKAPAP